MATSRPVLTVCRCRSIVAAVASHFVRQRVTTRRRNLPVLLRNALEPGDVITSTSRHECCNSGSRHRPKPSGVRFVSRDGMATSSWRCAAATAAIPSCGIQGVPRRVQLVVSAAPTALAAIGRVAWEGCVAITVATIARERSVVASVATYEAGRRAAVLLLHYT